MAAVVKCDACGKCVKHTDAMHLRAYRLANAENFDNRDCKLHVDLCKDCYRKFAETVGKEVK